MAAGGGSWKGYTVLTAAVVVTVLASTGVWNPFPQVWEWVNRSEPVAAGARWQQRIGGTPQSIAVVGDAVIVEYRTSVEAFGLTAAVPLWKSDFDWAAIAGSGDDAVVVTGRLLTKGYQVLDPQTGAVRRSDTTAGAVWTYRDAIVDLSCSGGNDCRLTAWDPKAGTELWSVDTGGIGFVLDAANPDLPDTRRLVSGDVDDDVAGPPPLPELIGLPHDGQIRVIDTAKGRVVATVRAGRDQRVVVVGGRVLTVSGTSADGTCYYEVVAGDPPGDAVVWRRDGLNLRTADNGADCAPGRDPAGGYNVLLGVDPYGREVLINGNDGRNLWYGDKESDVLAVNDSYAVIREGDTVRGYSFSKDKAVWRQTGREKAGAALTPYAAIVVSKNRVTALAPASGAVRVDVRTGAKVFAAGPEGLIAVSGRDMAYLPFS
ncbi:PQQ-binding-like beta-propeller repeat protein [Actinoplanes missouriensis]|uniref:PQQ-binding-like beta-propeller repeat protein n=1 Tax=Actinoplanes missouriensis TaxID=1866 RepID=UPI00059F8E99|nr:PQQ-binding-like beta-propeller repeat protein [Actinoplanes missouriensis]